MHSGRLCRLSCDPYYKVFAQLSGRIRRFRINKVVPGGRVAVGGGALRPDSGNLHVPGSLAGTGGKRALQPVSDSSDDLVVSSTMGAPAVSESAAAGTRESGSETTTDLKTAERPPSLEAKQEPEANPAVTRFASCRWHEAQDAGAAYCSHLDVLPFAGKNGFNAEAWCLECAFFKVKRIAKKRTTSDYDAFY